MNDAFAFERFPAVPPSPPTLAEVPGKSTEMPSPAMPYIEAHGFPSVARHLSASTRSMPFHDVRVGPESKDGLV